MGKLQFLYSALRKGRVDREIDDELRFHLEMTINENLKAGMSTDEATKDAFKRFGSLTRIKESSREVRRGITLESIAHDIRHGARLLRKHPGFSFVLVITMALGIGANAAIFSVVDSVLLRPLPYERPNELALIWSSFQLMGASRAPSSGTQLQEIRDRSQLLKDVAGIWVGNGTLAGTLEPEQVKIGDVTTNFFSVLGVKPSLGGSFTPEKDGNGLKEIMLTYGLWQRRFAADKDIVGKGILLNGRSFTVVGVLAKDFVLAFPVDANVPMNVQAFVPFQENIYEGPKDLYYIRLLARMKPGVTIEQAQAEATSVATQLRTEYAEYKKENLQFNVVQLHQDVVRDIKPALLALFVGAGLVVLISCFNVSNLLLAHASTRRKEIALRVAIGASRSRIARQLLTESLLVCFLGGVLGLGIGWVGLKLLLTIRPEILTRVGSVSINLPLVAFVSALTFGCGLIASLAPLLELRKLKLIEPLKEEARATSGRAKQRTRSLLMVSEMALGFVLLVGAGLMIRTLVQLHRVSPGFNPSKVLTFEMIPAGGLSQRRTSFVDLCEQKLAALPGVEAVGAISHLPLDDYPNWYSPYAPEGIAEDQKANLLADYRAVTPGYFQAIGAQLIAGRSFDKHDTAEGHPVVIVDSMLARQTWSNDSPLGRRINIERFTDEGFANGWAEVVGVVEHIKGQSLLKSIRGQIYIPYPQSSREHLSFVLRTSQDPSALAGLVRKEISEIDKTRAIAKVRPMEDYVSRALAPTNFTTVLATVFAVVALLLATVGIYAVVSYSVSQRTHEMGVRMALGARPANILRLVLKEGLALTAVGVTLGLAGALVLSNYISSLLFEVTAKDPLTYFVMALVIPLASIAACWRPARKAASGNVLDALRK
ncbi:MAG TPA: ABC transporter permease [Pyrinomonadaceae bacterium]|nr:ABC transporter permease [Pyrinomonadaceae bacterium]